MGHKWDKCQFLPTIIRYLWWGCSSLPWSILRWVKPKLKYQSAWYTTQKAILHPPMFSHRLLRYSGVRTVRTSLIHSPQWHYRYHMIIMLLWHVHVSSCFPRACLVPNECRTWGESPAMLKITGLLGVAACYRIPVKIQDILNKTSQIIWMWLTLSWFIWVKQ